MDKIQDKASQALQNAQQQRGKSGKQKTLPPRMIINLWERMSHIYGHKWASAYGETAIDGENVTDAARTWLSGLSGVSGEQIADGLRKCMDRQDPWPPTLPEFRQLCLGSGINEFGLDYVPEYHRPRIDDKSRLLRDKTHKERCEDVEPKLEKLRSSLRGNG